MGTSRESNADFHDGERLRRDTSAAERSWEEGLVTLLLQ
jgi:hypothetical protein